MKQIYLTTFGSRLYGTALPTSDFDTKGVFLPAADQILYGDAPSTFTPPITLGDQDSSSFSFARYLELLCEGQTNALDMLFAPAEMWRCFDPLWYDVLRNKERFLSRQCKDSIGYARAQAEKYSLRGQRIAALEAVIDVLEKYPITTHVEDAMMAGGYQLTSLPAAIARYITLSDPQTEGGVRFLEVCGKKVGFTTTVFIALEIFRRALAGYGTRARQAQDGGADWKALYHAVRITSQTVELLETGHVTFPRPDAADLLKIRGGEYAPEAVYERIEAGIAEIEAAQKHSQLPEEPDREFARELIIKTHREIIESPQS